MNLFEVVERLLNGRPYMPGRVSFQESGPDRYHAWVLRMDDENIRYVTNPRLISIDPTSSHTLYSDYRYQVQDLEIRRGLLGPRVFIHVEFEEDE